MLERLVSENLTRSITVLSRDELKQDDMEKDYPDVEFIVGDVRDYDTVRLAMENIDFVFHAAALKQVPRCEKRPIEAVQTNVLGTDNVLKAAFYSDRTEQVTVLSTDKAVAPVNVMGMTKSLLERFVYYWNDKCNGSKKFICARYGNVIGSRGSVIPFFKKRIESRQFVPVTDERMTRFMLTLDQAITFILDATDRCKGGEVFVPKLPSMKIIDLAELMTEGKDVEVRLTEIRPGEKIHEVMVSHEESFRCIDIGDYFVVMPTTESLLVKPTEREVSSKDFVSTDKNYWRKLISEEGLMP